MHQSQIAPAPAVLVAILLQAHQTALAVSVPLATIQAQDRLAAKCATRDSSQMLIQVHHAQHVRMASTEIRMEAPGGVRVVPPPTNLESMVSAATALQAGITQQEENIQAALSARAEILGSIPPALVRAVLRVLQGMPNLVALRRAA